jgi:DNA polymerase
MNVFDTGRAARVVKQRLESLRDCGVTHVARRAVAPESAHPASSDSLDKIRREVAECRLCAPLADSRTQTVFGVGNSRARLCFLGEAPGADEDRQGEPFVGRAGQLLNKIIEACTLSRGDVYILNILKCRPPGNRNPEPQEAENCRPFLDRQLALIRPEFICCLGAVAAHNLLQTDTPIGRMRGKFYDYRGIRVMCTYHPAYLLRNPSAKRQTWEDMQMLMAEMGIELPRS